MGVWSGGGREVLRVLGDSLDELHADVAAPVTARRTWLQAWVDAYPDHEPFAIAVGDERRGWDAVAVLALRRGRIVHRVVACGHGPSDAAMLPARDGDGADRLARALADELAARSGPWSMALRHVVPQDLVVPRLAGRLARARLVTGDVSPVLRAEPGTSLRDYVSSSHRKGVSRIRNRMVREGLDPTVGHVCGRDEVSAMLPDLERLHRARDLQLGRRCPLDDPGHQLFFRRVLLDHAERGEVVMTVLHLAGQLAAYVVCFVDGGVHRMWNTRFDPAWERLSPGKLAMEASVDHAVGEGCDYDFMRGEETYKASFANDAVVAQDLHASSGAVVAARTAAYVGARLWLRDARARESRAAEVVDTLREVPDRWRARRAAGRGAR